MIIFTDEVIGQMKRDIASHAPERGGALLGPYHTNLISLFLFDPQASTTAASYMPSAELVERTEHKERTTALTFKGIVHSHPNGMDRPSQADLHAFASNLAANSRLGSFVAPIISRGQAAGAHEIDLGSNTKLSCFEAFRPRPDSFSGELADCERTAVQTMAIEEAVSGLADSLKRQLGVPFKTASDVLDINGLGYLARRLKCRLFQLDLFFPHNYPCVPPIALYSKRSKGKLLDAQDLQFPWGFSCLTPGDLANQMVPVIINLQSAANEMKQEFERNAA